MNEKMNISREKVKEKMKEKETKKKRGEKI